MKRILIFDNYLLLSHRKDVPVGGATVQSLAWRAGFEELGEVFIVSTVEVLRADLREREYTIHSKYKGIFGFIHSFIKFLSVLYEIKPNIVYVSTANMNTVFVGLGELIFGFKYVQRISNDIVYTETYRRKIGNFRYKLSLLFLNRARIVACQNDFQMGVLESFNLKSRILKVYNPFLGFNFNFPPADRKYIAWVGIFQYQKNMRALLELANQMSNFDFRIAGACDPNVDQDTEDCIQELRGLHNVKFVGFLSRYEVLDLLRQSHCLLCTSHFEGFSNTFLEAFSVNTPVVTRHITDPDNIILRHQLGFVVDEISEMPKAIAKCFDRSFEMSKYMYDYHIPLSLAEYIFKNLEND